MYVKEEINLHVMLTKVEMIFKCILKRQMAVTLIQKHIIIIMQSVKSLKIFVNKNREVYIVVVSSGNLWGLELQEICLSQVGENI